MKEALAFVQARMRSRRLPGKSLMPLWRDRCVLEVLLSRLKSCAQLDGIVVLAPASPSDDPIEALCARLSVPCFRGDEENVLGRFAAASERHPSRSVLRICADNPLTDPGEVDRLAAFFRDGRFDYASNHSPDCCLADGLGAEIMTRDCLLRLHTEAQTKEEREHVTPRVHQRPGDLRVAKVPADPKWRRPAARLDVDFPRDLEFLRRLCESLDPSSGPLWTGREILAALDENPALLGLREPR